MFCPNNIRQHTSWRNFIKNLFKLSFMSKSVLTSEKQLSLWSVKKDFMLPLYMAYFSQASGIHLVREKSYTTDIPNTCSWSVESTFGGRPQFRGGKYRNLASEFHFFRKRIAIHWWLLCWIYFIILFLDNYIILREYIKCVLPSLTEVMGPAN